MDKIVNKLILLRHEQRPLHQGFNTSLTLDGLWGSKNIPNKLIERQANPDIIYSSPYLRCLQTIQPLKKYQPNVKIRVDNCLSEWVLPEDRIDITVPRLLTEIENEQYQIDLNYQPVLEVSRIPETENVKHLMNRVKIFLDYLINTYSQDTSVQKILIVTHLSVINAILALCHIKNVNLERDHQIDMGNLIMLNPYLVW